MPEKKKGEMTVREAGHLGGEKVKEERGPEFFSEIGHKGGQTVKRLIEEGKGVAEKEEKK
ncbi:MAG: Em GEA1 (EM1) [Candidatus Sericytochromatia bacterium]|nr:Em GEA1 (EM1) [Candidatus Tanganyikabacteria bacterium]